MDRQVKRERGDLERERSLFEEEKQRVMNEFRSEKTTEYILKLVIS